jgi:hypothetical protein
MVCICVEGDARIARANCTCRKRCRGGGSCCRCSILNAKASRVPVTVDVLLLSEWRSWIVKRI